jgi:formamidopyrimidine-DNA glycosylase
MPELPEVEVTRLSFVDKIAGATVVSSRLGKALRWPLGCAPELLQGQTVRTVRRRGKYLLIDMDKGLLMVHLGMSGSLSFARQLRPAGTHDHFELVTTKGTLRLNDPRRFGSVVYAASEDSGLAARLMARLGVEPLSEDFALEQFHVGLKRRKAAIKQVLLAGDVVVGVGNIYACETLFLAGIRPTSSAARLSRRRVAKLHSAIRDVLSRAVAVGGSTLRDFSSSDGEAGHFQLEVMVYGRDGQPCRVCGTTIKTLRQGQRSTFFCPKCQKV